MFVDDDDDEKSTEVKALILHLYEIQKTLPYCRYTFLFMIIFIFTMEI